MASLGSAQAFTTHVLSLMEANKDDQSKDKLATPSSENDCARQKTFSQAVEGKRFLFPEDAKFETAQQHEDEGHLMRKQGEVSPSKRIIIKPNGSLLSAISSNISRLRDSTIFLSPLM